MKQELPDKNKLNPFRTDADYFDFFASQLPLHVERYEELKDIVPLLASLPVYNPFLVPEGYFDLFPQFVRERTAVPARTRFMELMALLFKPSTLVPLTVVGFMAFAGMNYFNQSNKAEVTTTISLEDELYAVDETTLIDAQPAEENSTEEEQAITEYLLETDFSESIEEL